MAKKIKQIAEGLGGTKIALDAATLRYRRNWLGDRSAMYLREDADLIDEVVEDAMRRRQLQA